MVSVWFGWHRCGDLGYLSCNPPVPWAHATQNPLQHSPTGVVRTNTYVSSKREVPFNVLANAGGTPQQATALAQVAARVRAQRAAKLQQDVEHMQAAADMLGRPQAGGKVDRGDLPAGYPRVEELASVITRLGQREQALAFHVRWGWKPTNWLR